MASVTAYLAHCSINLAYIAVIGADFCVSQSAPTSLHRRTGEAQKQTTVLLLANKRDWRIKWVRITGRHPF